MHQHIDLFQWRSPCATDLNPLWMAAGATFTLVGQGSGQRSVAAKDFFLGYRKVDMQPHEVLLKVSRRCSCSQRSCRGRSCCRPPLGGPQSPPPACSPPARRRASWAALLQRPVNHLPAASPTALPLPPCDPRLAGVCALHTAVRVCEGVQAGGSRMGSFVDPLVVGLG